MISFTGALILMVLSLLLGIIIGIFMGMKFFLDINGISLHSRSGELLYKKGGP